MKINIKRFFFKLTVWATGLFCFVITFAQIMRIVNPDILPVKYKELSNCSSAVVFFVTALMLFVTFLIKHNFSNYLKSNLKIFFILLVVFGCLLRIVSVVMIKNEPVSDFKIYHELAVSLTEGTGFAYTGFTGLNEDVKLYLNGDADNNKIIPTNFRPCGYPVILSLIYRVFGIYPLSGKIFNILFSLVAGICLFFILLDINILFAYFTALFWFIYPSNIFAVNLLGTETVYLSFFTASLLLLKKAFVFKNPYKNILIIISGLLSGYSCLIRPYIFVLICILGGLILTAKKSERPVLSIIVFVISFSVPLFLWGVRNYEKFGHFQVQPNNAGPTLVIRTEHIEPLINYKYGQYEKKMRSVRDEFKLNKIGLEIFKRRLILGLKNNPVKFFTKFVKMNIICAWSHDSDILLWMSRSNFFSGKTVDASVPVREDILKKLYVFTNSFFLYISILALFGFVKMSKTIVMTDRYLLILIFYFILNFILLCLYRGTPRYHFDSMIILFIFAGYVFCPSKK